MRLEPMIVTVLLPDTGPDEGISDAILGIDVDV
jgi:hypothetical protein